MPYPKFECCTSHDCHQIKIKLLPKQFIYCWLPGWFRQTSICFTWRLVGILDIDFKLLAHVEQPWPRRPVTELTALQQPNFITTWPHTVHVFHFLYSIWSSLLRQTVASHVLSMSEGYCCGIQILKKQIQTSTVYFMPSIHFSAFDKHLCKKYAILFCHSHENWDNYPCQSFFPPQKSFLDFCVFLMARTG